MFLWMIAFVGGVILLYCFATLPAHTINIAVIIFAAGLLPLKKLRLMSFLLFGFGYAVWDAERFIEATWPASRYGEIVKLSGYVCGLPEISVEKITFDFCVEKHITTSLELALPLQNIASPLPSHASSPNADPWFQSSGFLFSDLHKIRATVYADYSAQDITGSLINTRQKQSIDPYVEIIAAGQLQIEAELRAPRGLVNFYGGLYETWLFSNHYQAAAIVKQLSPRADFCSFWCRLHKARMAMLQKIKIKAAGLDSANFLLALTLGDRSGLSRSDWTILTNTGTTHLIAISGMHVSALGLLVFILIHRLTRKLISPLRAFPYRFSVIATIAAFCSVAMCSVYVFVAGAGVPVQRAFVMYSVALALATFSKFNSYSVLIVALFVIILIDPRSVLQGATWLSFGAVFVLTMLFAKRIGTDHWIVSAAKMNLSIFFSMFALLAALSLPVSWLSALVNLVAVPIVIFCLLPLAALVFCLIWLDMGVARHFLLAFDAAYQWYWLFLQSIAALNLTTLVNVSISVLFSIAVLGLLVLLPVNRPLKLMVFLLLAGFYKFPPGLGDNGGDDGGVDDAVSFYDVGQGTAVLLGRRGSKLLYDFGPAYGVDSDAGERVLLPQLRAQNIDTIAMAIVSHNDLDHRGGFNSVAQNLKIDSILAGQPELLSVPAIDCQSVEAIQIDRLSVEVLWPSSAGLSTLVPSSNNHSCVIRVEVDGISVLLSGDVDGSVERWLVRQYGARLKSDVLLVGHHGSQTSSSWAFLKTVQPKVAIYSAAYKSRFGHPARKVQERFQRLGIKTYNTATVGGIALKPIALNPFNFGKTVKAGTVAPEIGGHTYFQADSTAWVEIRTARNARDSFWLAKDDSIP